MVQKTGRNVFGGPWTQEKLKIIEDYLSAYMRALKNQPFRKVYIDAFAGSGSIYHKDTSERNSLKLPLDEDTEEFLRGSASIAIEIKPPFDSYVFIEKDEKRCRELERFKDVRENITIKRGDANSEIQKICFEYDWRTNRAILFLDPYGMQVKWETLKRVAETKSVDLWYLFSIGGVNRLLPKNGFIDQGTTNLLNDIFGTNTWYDSFYEESNQLSFFRQERPQQKVSFPKISDFIVSRLRTIFPGVAEKPRLLINSKNSPLFLLCFACSNPSQNALRVAMRIANDLLTRINNE